MSLEHIPERNTYVFYKTHESLDKLFIMNNGNFWFIILLAIVYYAFVLKIGPEFMKRRKPFQLKRALMIYNIYQVVMSLTGVILSLDVLLTKGFIPKRTSTFDEEYCRMMRLSVPLGIVAKCSELFDTVFFVLRKKFDQVTFLHVYHHSIMVVSSWVFTKYSVNHTSIWTTFINSSVHVVMYFYYFLAGLGPQYQKYLTWKNYVTIFQIVQFLTVFIHLTASLMYTKGEYVISGVIFQYANTIIFLVLFLRFYLLSYTKKSKTGQSSIKKKDL